MITAEQLRAARAMLRIEQGILAERANVSVETIKRLEAMTGELKGRDETIRSIVRALQFAGVEFIGGDTDKHGGVGVRFAIDRSARIISAIADAVAEMARTALTDAFGSDPETFNRGPEHLSKTLNTRLPNLIQSAMPDIIDPKS